MRLIALLLTGVIGPFAPPLPYGAGHRGVDFAAEPGEAVLSPVSGQVFYVGSINGIGTLTLAFADRKLTFQPVQARVAAGALVQRGEVIAVVSSARYHCSSCLHIGLRQGRTYLNPMMFTKAQLLPVGRSTWISND